MQVYCIYSEYVFLYLACHTLAWRLDACPFGPELLASGPVEATLYGFCDMPVPLNDVFVASIIAGSISTAAVVYNSTRVRHRIVRVPKGLRHRANTLPVMQHPCSACLGSSKITCTRCTGKGVLPT